MNLTSLSSKMNMTPRLERAITVAATAHRRQTRKGSDIPYITHPFSVMCIASQATNDEDILIACLFHDIVEDVPEEYSHEKMLEEFGERVVSIVDGVTKDGSINDWQGRAEAYLTNLKKKAPDESVVVSCADKIHNLMSTLEDYRTIGDTLWERFNAGKAEQQWWYREVLKVCTERQPELILNTKLAELVDQIEKI